MISAADILPGAMLTWRRPTSVMGFATSLDVNRIKIVPPVLVIQCKEWTYSTHIDVHVLDAKGTFAFFTLYLDNVEFLSAID